MPTKAEKMRLKAQGVADRTKAKEPDSPAETAPLKPVSTGVRDSSPVEPKASPAPARTAAKPASTRARPKAGARTKPIKMTVDLAPIEHRKLKLWCAQAAADLELPEVAASEVVRVLVARLQSDPDLAERIRADLAENGGSRRGW
jgi:hypothetical protein